MQTRRNEVINMTTPGFSNFAAGIGNAFLQFKPVVDCFARTNDQLIRVKNSIDSANIQMALHLQLTCLLDGPIWPVR